MTHPVNAKAISPAKVRKPNFTTGFIAMASYERLAVSLASWNARMTQTPCWSASSGMPFECLPLAEEVVSFPLAMGTG